jgi:thiol:disulfide interchange protein DsbC
VGELYSVSQQGVTNVTETGRAKEREKVLATVSAEDMIQYKPEGEVKAVVNVFTDIDCPYCRKLHQDVPRLNELGIQVNYLAYPRSGPDTPSHAKYVSVFCADDSREAMNRAKSGRKVESRTCENPVTEQFRLGSRVGVTGTPAIILEDGQVIRGYVPAENLARRIGVL